jgi:hypothetical protein
MHSVREYRRSIIAKNIKNSGKAKIKRRIIFVLMGNPSRYPYFKDAEQVPSEITV